MEIFSLEKLVESGAFETEKAEAMFKVSEIARKEYGIAIVLDRLQWDVEFRRRVRGLLKELPAEKKPGPKPVMSDAVVYELIKALQSHGNTLTKCYDLLARDGLKASSIKRKFKRYRSKSKAKG